MSNVGWHSEWMSCSHHADGRGLVSHPEHQQELLVRNHQRELRLLPHQPQVSCNKPLCRLWAILWGQFGGNLKLGKKIAHQQLGDGSVSQYFCPYYVHSVHCRGNAYVLFHDSALKYLFILSSFSLFIIYLFISPWFLCPLCFKFLDPFMNCDDYNLWAYYRWSVYRNLLLFF